MNASASTKAADSLPESQRRALVSLLSDEDPTVHELVRARLIECGPAALEWLRPHAGSPDPLMRQRAREIMTVLGRQTAHERFLEFCRQPAGTLNLEAGAWLLAQTRYPDCDIAAYGALLDRFAAGLAGRVDPASHAEANLLAINQHLFQRLGFRGNEEDYYRPDNSYLNRVVDTRLGNPISLCALYMMVARRLRLAVAGVGMPGHFLCLFQAGQSEVFIDCFNHGRFLSRDECLKYLAQTQPQARPEHLAPVDSRSMLLRMCANLHQAALRRDEPEEAERFQPYLSALGGG